jgi:hypothetical protein
MEIWHREFFEDWVQLGLLRSAIKDLKAQLSNEVSLHSQHVLVVWSCS